MRSLFLSLAVFSALALSSCSTRAKTYVAPNAARLDAASKRLAAAVTTSKASAAVASKRVGEARVAAQKLSADIVAAVHLFADLETILPELLAAPTAAGARIAAAGALEAVGSVGGAFEAKFAELKSALAEIQADKETLDARLLDAESAQAQLDEDLGDVAIAKQESDAAAAEVKRDGTRLAQEATNERNFRIAAEKQLFAQRVFGVLWKIGGGLVVAGIILLAFLYFSGRVAWTGAKIAAKF